MNWSKILGLLGAPFYLIAAYFVILSQNGLLMLVFFGLTFYLMHRRFKKKHSDKN